MNNKWKHSLALILTLALLLALPAAAAWADDGDPAEADTGFDLGRAVALKIQPAVSEMLEADPALEDAAVIDFYKVADAVAIPGYQAYDFAPVGGFAALDLSELPSTIAENAMAAASEYWAEIAQQAAAVVRADGAEPVAVSESGLYLVIAHGGRDDYWLEDDEGGLATVVETEQFVYTYAPQLVSLPSNVETIAEGANVNTATNEWKYDVTAVLKCSREIRYGDLVIEKLLDLARADSVGTFIFRIHAESNLPEGAGLDAVVYDNVVALSFDAAGTQTKRIEGMIPVGSTVTVEEIYSGSGYVPVGAVSAEGVIPAPEDGAALTLSFENTADEGVMKIGSGIENRFTYNESTEDFEHTVN